MRWLSAVGWWTVLLSGDFDRTIGEKCLGVTGVVNFTGSC